MAGDILLTPENLMDEASKLLANKRALDEVFNSKIANLISGLVEHWHGEAQQAFENSFKQKRTVFDKFSQDMESFSNFMKKYAKDMQDTENNQKNLAGKLGG